jgi:hypothetical protein
MLVLATPMAAQPQGNGKGQRGGGHSDHRGGDEKGGQGAKARGASGGQASRGREARGPDRQVRHASAERGRSGDRPQAQRASERRGPDRGNDSVRIDRDIRGRGNDRDVTVIVDRRDRPDRVVVRRDGDRDRSRFRVLDGPRYRWEPVFFNGCPPGLARKGNGCLPPGQARKIADRNFYWARYAPWYDDAIRYDWRYADGYAYRVDPTTGLIGGLLPLLGGALYPGQVWPASYTTYDVDPYYDRYYGFDDPYDYRYADGALLAVDPETQAIAAIAALLTGDDWLVGSPMPIGYDAYNMPPPYRERYYDTDDAWYRYSDGYVYRVEPRTRIVRETILLPV